MGFEEFIDEVGSERYYRACRTAQARLQGDFSGSSSRQNEDPHQVADEVRDLVEKHISDRSERLELLLRLYADCPNYHSAKMLWWASNGTIRKTPGDDAYWEAIRRRLLESDPGQEDPLLYSLAVDWFEATRSSRLAWRRLTRNELDGRVLLRLLQVSATVPWAAKADTFDYIASQRVDMHDRLADAIIAASSAGTAGSCDELDRLAGMLRLERARSLRLQALLETARRSN